MAETTNTRTRLLRDHACRQAGEAFARFVADPTDEAFAEMTVAGQVYQATMKGAPIILDNLVGQHVHAMTGRLTDGETEADAEGAVLAWEALARAAGEKR